MGRLVGLDFGKARIGVALSDERKVVATPLDFLPNTKQFPEALREKLKNYGNVEGFVLGLPLQMNGKEGEMAQEVRKLKQELESLFALPVTLWDERLSTAQVEKELKGREMRRKKQAKIVDSLAACLILQSFLDSL